MDKIMAVISLLFFIALIVGLIKPSAVLGFMKTNTRGRVFLIYGIGFFAVSFLAASMKQSINPKTSNVAKTPLPTEEQCRQASGEEAIQVCQKVVEVNPDSADARKKLDETLVHLGRGREAIQRYTDKIKDNPSDANQRAYLCRVYVLMQFYDEGLQSCQKAIEINPALPKTHNNLGLAWAGKNQDEKALESYRKAIQHDPNFIEPHINIVLSLEKLKRLEEALKEIDIMAQQWPADDRVYVLRGGILFGLKRDEEALSALKKATIINPKGHLAFGLLGGWYSSTGKYEEAVENLKKAEALKPDEPEIHRNLGLVYYMLKRKSEALSSFQTYLKLKPSDTEVQKYVASLQAELGSNENRESSPEGGSTLYNMAHDTSKIPSDNNGYVSTDFSEYSQHFSSRSNITEMQKDQLFDSKYKGRFVKWTGRVEEVDKGILGGVNVMVKHLRSTLISDVILDLKPEEEAKALQLRKGQTIVYVGRLTSWGEVLPHGVDNGVILEVR